MQLYNQTYIPREDMLCLPSAPQHAPIHTHPPNHQPSPTHTIAIITHTDTSLHYINTPLKANQTVTPTKAFHNILMKQTNKNKRTSRLGDLRCNYIIKHTSHEKTCSFCYPLLYTHPYTPTQSPTNTHRRYCFCHPD